MEHGGDIMEEIYEIPQLEDISQQLVRISEEMKTLANAYREAHVKPMAKA